MTGLWQWLRSLRWLFAAQRELCARVVRLEQALAVERAEHYGQVADIGERHGQFVADLREGNAELRVECQRLDREVDGLRDELARATGKGVARVSAAVRD